METKHCNKCDTTKPVTSFGFRKRGCLGLKNYCKECCNRLKRLNRDGKAEYQRRKLSGVKRKPMPRSYYREQNQKRKALCIYHYAPNGKCAKCPFADIRALSIDHVDGGGNKHRKEIGEGSQIYRWLIKNNFPDGFQVLCMNCQFIKRHENQECKGGGSTLAESGEPG